jgi:UDP-3-O-[3-hydroxymyristoyl] glucosamine N-acyltransferase
VSASFTARQIADLCGGQLTGNPDEPVTGVAGIREARPGELTFVASPKYLSALKTTRATVVIVARDAKIDRGSDPGATRPTLIRVDHPVPAFMQVVQRLAPPPVGFPPGIHPTAVIAPAARLGTDVSIQPHAVIEDGAVIGDRTIIGAGSYIGHGCVLGADCRLYAHVTLREYTVLGQRVILHSGVVLGADGFGYEPVQGKHQKIPQVGTVEIGDDVEIGANTAIDRARFGKTRVGRGTKIDNLVQIGHNCVIGEDCIICGGCGLAGSSILGNHVTLAGQVGVAGHLTIGDGAIVMAQSGVTKDVAPGAFVWGTPALPHTEAKRVTAAIHRLPETTAKLRAIEKLLAELPAKLQ